MTTTRRHRPVELTDAPEHRSIPIEQIELRSDEGSSPDELILTGYASTFEPYEMYGGPERYGWIEQIDRNAFDKTLREKPDLHLLINHAGMPLARTKSGTLSLSVDDHGLKVEARLDRRDPEVQSLEVKMARGDMDEMSFAFRVKAQEWSAAPGFEDLEDDQTFRMITEVSLHKGDVSVVNFGANPTTHAEVKSIPEALRVIAEADERELAEVRSDDDVANLKIAQERLAAVRGTTPPAVHIENLVVEGEEARDEEEIADSTGGTLNALKEAKRQAEAFAEAFPTAPTGDLVESLGEALDGIADVIDGILRGLTPPAREAESETEEAPESGKGMSLRYAQALLED